MLHCNGIDPFVTLMGNFNWGPISRNDIVSRNLQAMLAYALKMIDLIACLIGRVIIFFLLDIVNGVQIFKLQCTNLQPVRICNLSIYFSNFRHPIEYTIV